MSVVNAAKNRDELNSLVAKFRVEGGNVSRIKSKRKLPKSLRYSPFTVNGKNHAPTFNPMKHGA